MASSLLFSCVLIPTLLTNWNLYSSLKKKGLRNINSFRIPSFKSIRFPRNGFHLAPPRIPIVTPNPTVVVIVRVVHRIQPLCLLPISRSPFRHPTPWNSSKPQCQICHKQGHTGDTCWRRYDPPTASSFNANISQSSISVGDDSSPSILGAPSTIEDPLWYPIKILKENRKDNQEQQMGK